jgi:hypothetical protein
VKVQFFDRHDAGNTLNGVMVTDSRLLRLILDDIDMRHRSPFFAELIGENDTKLLLGLGPSVGCVQFSATDGSPPYLIAVEGGPERGGEQGFFMGNALTLIPRRYCVPMGKVLEIAILYFERGERASTVGWESI